MIYVRTPTDAELQELKRITRQDIGRVSQRAHMVLLSAERRSVPEIATIFAVKNKTVRKWLRRFDTEGPIGLYDDPRSGRPRTLTEKVRSAVTEMLDHDPEQSGYAANICCDVGAGHRRETRRVSERE